MDYDALLVATGGMPVRLNIPGADLKNVCVLRSFADADSIIEAARRSRRAVVVGASFIGMEAAYSLRERGLEVTVVAPSQEPFETTLGRKSVRCSGVCTRTTAFVSSSARLFTASRVVTRRSGRTRQWRVYRDGYGRRRSGRAARHALSRRRRVGPIRGCRR